MKLDKLTTKLKEALQDALDQAREANRQQVEPEEIMLSLLRQEDGISLELLDKAGIATFPMIRNLGDYLKQLPQVSGAQVYLSARANRLFVHAGKEAEVLHDDYISCEHVVLACAADPESVFARECKKQRLS